MCKSKKMLSCFIALIFCMATLLSTSLTFATDGNTSNEMNFGQTVSYAANGDKVYTINLSEEQLNELLDQKAEQEVQAVIKEAQDNSIATRSTSKPVYTTTYGAYKYPKAEYRPIAGQPEGGYHFNTGGKVHISKTGGTKFAFTYAFPAPFGKIGISATPGKRVTKVTGLSATIPASKNTYYRVYMSNTYKAKPYVIYEIINKKTGKKKAVHRGAAQVIYDTNLSVRVK